MARSRLTRGTTQVPNSFIENLSAFTPAERSLALLLFRRGENSFHEGGHPVQISDATWERWTGLSKRQKDYAAAGLREKCLRVEGQGDEARYYFDPQTWRSYVLERESIEARTHGRSKVKPVPAKKGMPIHPDCSEGCAMLREAALNPPAAELKPVSELPVKSKLVPLALRGPSNPPPSSVSTFPLSENTLRNIFPSAGSAFLALLVQACERQGVRPDDVSLERAIGQAWELKRRVQKSEGLFLSTVPPVLKAIQAHSVASGSMDIKVLDCLAVARENELQTVVKHVESIEQAAQSMPKADDMFLSECRIIKRLLAAPDFDPLKVFDLIEGLQMKLVLQFTEHDPKSSVELVRRSKNELATLHGRSLTNAGLIGNRSDIQQVIYRRLVLDRVGVTPIF